MTTKTGQKYIEGIGRRKTAIARVRITPSTKSSIEVNGKSVADYFNTDELRNITNEALTTSGVKQNFTITAKIIGGGIKSQAESLRLGLSRALIVFNHEFRKDLKKAGFLKRDPRIKERKKPGFKKARKRPQWSKR